MNHSVSQENNSSETTEIMPRRIDTNSERNLRMSAPSGLSISTLLSLIVLVVTSTTCAKEPSVSASDYDSPAVWKSNSHLQKFQQRFYLGSHLAREPMPPMSELKRDMETLKNNGFNLIKLQVQWAPCEPEEGEFNFSKYEDLIAHAQGLDLDVYIGATLEQAPPWLFEKYPDCRMVGKDGTPIAHIAQSPMPADGKPGPCFDHPDAAAAQQRFLTALVKTLGKFDNVTVWNTWQEIGYWPDRLVGQPVCYCEHTMTAFRGWLKAKYGSLENLNDEWNTTYARWEYIQPSRNYLQRFTLPQDVNWQYFMENPKITHVLKQRASVIRENDSLERPIFSHLGSWNYGSGKDWNYARSQDFLGSSSYPASNWGEFNDWDDSLHRQAGNFTREQALLEEVWRMIALRFDYLRSCNVPGHPIWAAEFQGGPVSTGLHKGRVPSADDMRRWMLSVVGSGATTISFWVTRAEIAAAEVNGFSLLDSVGDSTPRFAEAARVGKALIKHQDLFALPTASDAEVAIFINEDNYELCANINNGEKHLEFSTRGWHRLLWDANIAVDFVEASVLAQTDLSKYQAIIVPFPMSIADTLLDKLGRYVESGGNLISEAGIARLSENAYANRGEISQRASELFGVKSQSFTMVREPDGSRRWSPQERTWGEYLDAAVLEGSDDLQGESTAANVYIQTFVPINSAPCLNYGKEVAGTVRNLGKGKAWLLGTYVGHNGTAYRNENTHNFVRKLMSLCGVNASAMGDLLVRKRKIDDKEAWILTNPTEHPVTQDLNIASWATATDLFDKPFTIKNQTIQVTVDSLDVQVVLLSDREL